MRIFWPDLAKLYFGIFYAEFKIWNKLFEDTVPKNGIVNYEKSKIIRFPENQT